MFVAPSRHQQESSAWVAPTGVGGIDAEVSLPGSKSLMARELVLAALADAPGKIFAPLKSRDSDLMIAALQALGTAVEFHDDAVEITPAKELLGSTTVQCGLAGTVMRFVPPVAALSLGPVSFDGDPYARKRPMAGLVRALNALGADVTDESLPFTVHGRGHVAGGTVEVDASASSQFVSGLLLAGARFENGVHVIHVGGRLPSVPHIEMTLDALAARGVAVSRPAEGQWAVAPAPIRARDVTIEPDLSNAAPFLAAALVLGGTVRIPNWPQRTTQVGDQLRQLLPQFGGTVKLADGVLTVTGDGEISGVDLHIPEAGELAPTLVGLAALANSPSTITGIGHIRHHETNRIAALIENIRALGGEAEELDDGISIVPRPLHGGLWKAFADHRMATTGALVGLKVSGVAVDDIGATSKTMPEFVELWSKLR